MAWVTSMDDLIYGEDGQSPIRSTLERTLAAAKRDETRLRIEVRSKGDGMPTSRQEHVFAADPTTTTAENVMQALVTRLNESPGEHFTGELRINFAAAGSSQERYGSFTRTIRNTPPTMRGVPGMSRMRIVEDAYDEDGEEIDNSTAALGSAGLDLEALTQMGNGGAWIPQEQQIQWLDTAFGFVFRSMAQQMAMFDRATRMMESYTLRFGMPNPMHPGIQEQKGGDAGSAGMGLLPMLMNAAAHLASANSPAEVVERAGNMAQGGAPPPGAARAAAIAGSANLVRGIPRNNPYRSPPTTRPFNPPPGPDFDDGDGTGALFENDNNSFDPDPDTDAGTTLARYDGDDSSSEPPMPDLRGLAPEQVKEVFVQWVRDNPDNKNAVMAMLPELAGEIA
jgi:hypothetical protein